MGITLAKPWFRLYSEFISDPKVQLLAFEDQRHFVAILCLKCNGTLDTSSVSQEHHERLIAKALGLDIGSATEAKRRLMEIGLIEQDWTPSKWDSRQYESDSSAVRMHKWREKKKATPSLDRHCDVTVTAKSRADTEQIQNRTDQNKPVAVATGGEGDSIQLETVSRVFDHWKAIWDKPRARLDEKRKKLIRSALKNYTEADLCQAISGYRNSPHHMGRNDRDTVYDDIGLLLRDSQHIDAGLRFYEQPPRQGLSKATRDIIDNTVDWMPPELRNATN